MKKKFLLLILLILLIVCALFLYRFKLKSDSVDNNMNQTEETQIEVPSDILEDVEQKDNEIDEQKNEKLNNKQKNKKISFKLKESKPDFRQQVPLPKSNIDEKTVVQQDLQPEEDEYKNTRLDVVNVQREYIAPKSEGSIYYRGVFYNVKVRQVNSAQEDSTVIEQKVEITSENHSESEKQIQDVNNVVQQSEFEQRMDETQKKTTALEKVLEKL